MKRLVWLAGIAWVIASTETIQAIPVKGESISVTGDETLRAKQVTTAKEALTKAVSVVSAPAAPTANKISMVTATLSPLVAEQEDRTLSLTLVSRDSYIPES